MSAPQARRRPRRSGERAAELASRVLIEGRTFGEVAREVGLSRERVRQLVRRWLADPATGLDEHEAALRARYVAGLSVVGSLEVADRVGLLAAVLWPDEALLEASLARVRALGLGHRCGTVAGQSAPESSGFQRTQAE